jgi:hypothetical protein
MLAAAAYYEPEVYRKRCVAAARFFPSNICNSLVVKSFHLTIDIPGLHLFSDHRCVSSGDHSGGVDLVRSSSVPGEKSRGLPIVLVKRNEGIGYATGLFVVPLRPGFAPLPSWTVKGEHVSLPVAEMARMAVKGEHVSLPVAEMARMAVSTK